MYILLSALKAVPHFSQGSHKPIDEYLSALSGEKRASVTATNGTTGLAASCCLTT